MLSACAFGSNPENPTEKDNVYGWCNKEDVVLKAWRAHNLGYRLMIDFHYSDAWADPGKQYKPQAWKDHSVEQLQEDIAKHTKDVLNTSERKRYRCRMGTSGQRNSIRNVVR